MGVSETVHLLIQQVAKWLRMHAEIGTSGGRYKDIGGSVSSYSPPPANAIIRDMTIWARSGKYSLMDGTTPSRSITMEQVFRDFVHEVRCRLAPREAGVFVCLFDDKNNLGLRKTQRAPKRGPEGLSREELDALASVPQDPRQPFRNMAACIHDARGFTLVAKAIRDMALTEAGMALLASAVGENQVLVVDAPAGHGAHSPSVVDFIYRPGSSPRLFHQRRYDLDNCIGEGDLKMVYWVNQYLRCIIPDFGIRLPSRPVVLTVSADTDQVVILLMNSYLWRSKGAWAADVHHHLERINNRSKLPEDHLDMNLIYDVVQDTLSQEDAWKGLRPVEFAVGMATAVATVALMQQSDFCPKLFTGCGVPTLFDLALRLAIRSGPMWKVHAERVRFLESRPASDSALVQFSVSACDATSAFVERLGAMCASDERSRYNSSRVGEDHQKMTLVRNVLQYWMNAAVDPGRRKLAPARLYNVGSYLDPRSERAEGRRLRGDAAEGSTAADAEAQEAQESQESQEAQEAHRPLIPSWIKEDLMIAFAAEGRAGADRIARDR